MKIAFDAFDLSDFWERSEYSTQTFVCPPPTEGIIATVEKELGYKLPSSDLELMNQQNGGIPKKRAFPTEKKTSWADNHVAITGIFGIGTEKANSLCGELGSRFMIDEWEYPDIGIYFADCPSAGHDMICMDYRKNGKWREPEIIHVDQKYDYEITFLAPNFEAFIKGLVHSNLYE